MIKRVKTSIIAAAVLFFSIPVFALDAPEMIPADTNGTALQPYYLSTTEVTQKLYQDVMGTNPSSCIPEDPAFSKMLAGEEQEMRPVETVTFFDAMLFCNRLTEETLGKDQCVYTLFEPVYDDAGHIIRFGSVRADFTKTGYRLPTREEWQNAAGTEPDATAMYAWFVDNSAARGEGRTGFGTHAVAKKLADANGLYDMYGNVAEMCHEGESLDLCIMGTAWNRIDEYYTDGYFVDYLYGYSQYTVSRNHARESFSGYDTCGFRLCRSISDLPYKLTGISVPNICDTYEGIVPVTITGSGFLCRRNEELSVRVEGFASELADVVEWLSDDEAVIPVKAVPLKIEGSQKATLRVVVETTTQHEEISGTVTRVHTEFPVHPADVVLDDGTVVAYEESRLFSGYEKEHAAAVVIYAPYDGTEIIALGLTAFDPSTAQTADELDSFVSAYGEKTGIFGSYLGSGWYLPSDETVACLSDQILRSRVKRVLTGIDADSSRVLKADGMALLTTDSTTLDGLFIPVKNISTRALITQKYEFLTANNMLKEAAEQEALIAQREAEEAAAAEAARKAAEEEARAEAAAQAAADGASESEGDALAADDADGEGAEDSPDGEDGGEKSSFKPFITDESRTLIGLDIDVMKVLDKSVSLSAEFSTSLFVPFVYIAAEGNADLCISNLVFKMPPLGLTLTTGGLGVTSWDAAAVLGLSVKLPLGPFHPGLFVAGGVMTDMAVIKSGSYVQPRFEAGLDIPVVKKFAVTARYSVDFDSFNLDAFKNNYRLTAGVSLTFRDFVLF